MKSAAAILLLATSGSAFVSPKVSLTHETRTSQHDWYTKSIVKNYQGVSPSSMRITRKASSTTSIQEGKQQYDGQCDVLVLGSGPAARSIATLLSSQNMDVILADQNLEREWPPNYGVWRDEWDAILKKYSSFGINLNGGNNGECVDREWPITDCFFGGSFNIPVANRVTLDRPYCRIDRFALRKALTRNYRQMEANHISKAIGVNIYTPAGSLVHDADGTTITLQAKDGSNNVVRTKLVVDTTGHETKLILRDTRAAGHRPPGFQIAYGCLVEIDESNSPDITRVGPYAKEAMTLFDYRTDHFDGDDVATRSAFKAPTFMYAMPLDGNRVFFEETSLVARPAISFQECKDRCFRRLEYLGIKVTKVEEEEFCYIPMGGALPIKDQRIIGLGGAAAMVHPSTGYHLCRCLMGASDVARAIQDELKSSPTSLNLDRASASAYHAIWSPENIRQRNFAVFGGEFLMEQNVEGLRGFFDGFFKLPVALWGGFLAGWPGLPNNENHESWYARMWYGLNFIVRIPPPVALSMVWSIITYSIAEGAPLLQAVTPFLGEPQSYEYEEKNANVGDVAAKDEARRMIQEAKLMQVPVDFDKDGNLLPSASIGQWKAEEDEQILEQSFQ